VNFVFKDKAIRGMAVVVPENERFFVDDMKSFNFSEARSRKLQSVMGYERHRVVQSNVCSSDLAIHGFNHLFTSGRIAQDSIDALVVVSLTPDHFLPSLSWIMHGKLGLPQRTVCFDVTQGCCGFVMGLIQSFMLLDQPHIRRVALVNVDVLSKKVSESDRNSYPLIGDAASITIVENECDAGSVYADVQLDGSRCMALKIPAGGFRLPSSDATGVLVEDEEGNRRSLDNLVMDGSAVFNFAMQEVPTLIESVLMASGLDKQSVDYFLFHQPNQFMLQKLAEKLGIPYEKMPSNVVQKYGNSSSVTIPAVVSLNLAERICREGFTVCFSGFGAGLTKGAMTMRTGKWRFCDTVVYPNV